MLPSKIWFMVYIMYLVFFTTFIRSGRCTRKRFNFAGDGTFREIYRSYSENVHLESHTGNNIANKMLDLLSKLYIPFILGGFIHLINART